MENGIDSTFREVGWNGIAFFAPALFEIVELGNSHMVLADDEGPVVEIKWGKGQGRFSPETQYRKLAARFGGLKRSELPQGWEEALAPFEFLGVSWEERRGAGKGAILRCRQCGRGILIQFHARAAGEMRDHCRRILETLRDHPGGGDPAWAVYDIRFTLPKAFELKKHSFRPGQYELMFSGKRGAFTLYRWGPASVLLGDGDLGAFSESVAGRSLSGRVSGLQAGCPALTWEAAPKRRLFHQGRGRDLFRIWHHSGNNRIFAVRGEGVDRETFEEICLNYEGVR